MFFLVQVGDRADPVHRRQHQLQRVPVPGQLRGRGLVPAPLADQARAPAGVLQRHHRADRAVAARCWSSSGANVNSLVPFYAIGVFTGVHHGRLRHGQVPPPAPGSRAGGGKLVINFVGRRATSLIVVRDLRGGEVHRGRLAGRDPVRDRGARAHPAEPGVPDGGRGAGADRRPAAGRRRAADTTRAAPSIVFVDSFDLATLAALRYARSLRPTTLRAVHFVIDTAQADQLREEWIRADRGVVLDFIDCPDRRLTRAAAELVSARGRAARHARHGGPAPAQLLRRCSAGCCTTAPLTRSPAWSAGSRTSAATIVPFDVRSRLETHARPAGSRAGEGTRGRRRRRLPAGARTGGRPEGAHGTPRPKARRTLPPVLAAPPPSALRNLLRGRARPAGRVRQPRFGGRQGPGRATTARFRPPGVDPDRHR